MATFDATLSTFILVNSLNYSINVFLSVVRVLRLLGDRIYSAKLHETKSSQPVINLLHFPFILLNCQQQTSNYWPYSQVDNCVRDWCHVTSSLYKMDTSLRQTVEAGPEGVSLRKV